MNLDLASATRLLTAEIARSQPFSFFLGAGASVSAGAPAGSAVIEEIKQELFTQAEGRQPRALDEIHEWWASQLGRTGNDYHDVLKRRFPDPGSRRDYFETRLSGLSPSPGHRSLARLMTGPSTRALLSRVITTNFDWLVESSLIQEAAEFPFVYDQAHQLPSNLPALGTPTILKVHGDYYYDDIANLEEELSERMESAMRNALQQALWGAGVILLGYRGGDAALMRELMVLLGQAPELLSGGVWWVHPARRSPLNATDVLERVRATGRPGYLIAAPDGAFDIFMASLEAAIVGRASTPKEKNAVARYMFDLRRSLSMRAFRRYPQELWTAPPDSARIAPRRMLDRCAPGNTAVVIGEAGCGKSSMLATLALDLLNEDHVPILCTISRGSTDLDVDPTQFEILRLARDRIVLLIDGLDEAARPDTILQKLPDIARRYGCPVLLTSRPLPQLAMYALRAEFTPLDLGEIRDFVSTLWGDRLALEFQQKLDVAAASRPHLVEICRNPMILTMASTTFARTGDLVGKCRLYDDLTRLRLQFYQHRLRTPEAALREAAERLGYYAERPGARTVNLAAAMDRHGSTDDDRVAADLVTCGLVRQVRKDWDFVHRSYQPFFAPRALLRELEAVPASLRLIGENLTTSEVNEFLGSYFDERKDRMDRLFNILSTSSGYSGTNLRYVLSFCRDFSGMAKDFVRTELTSQRWERPQQTVQDEGRLLNSAFAGLMAGDHWCLGAWLGILLRDRCDDSWNICEYGGTWHPKTASRVFSTEEALATLREAEASPADIDALCQTLMHVGHLAAEGTLERRDEFRGKVERLGDRQWGGTQFQVVMNMILALYRFNEESVLDQIFSSFGGERGLSVNWRVPRSILRAVLHLAPRDASRRQRATEFIMDLVPRLRMVEAYQRQLLQVQCILALTRMGMRIPEGLDDTPAVRAARQWRVVQDTPPQAQWS